MSSAKQTRTTLSIPEAMDLARRRHQAGVLGEAKQLYRLILESQPNHTEAMTLMASALYRQGADQDAAEFVDRAVELYINTIRQQGNDPQIVAPLVNLLLARGRRSEAEARAQALDFPVLPVRATQEAFEDRRQTAIAAGRRMMLITTVPKSASESIWNRLAEGLKLGQCFLSLGLFPDCCLLPSRVRFAARGGLIVKEHIAATPHNCQTLVEYGQDRIVVHLRDPRQALLSWIHFVRDDVSQRLLAPLWRKIVPQAEVLSLSLEAQLDWGIAHYLPYLIDFVKDWTAVDDDPESGLRVCFASFERFRQDPDGYVDSVLDFYDIDKAAFRRDSEAEVVHLRKGLIDEWRGVFTPAQKERAWALIPDDMAERHGWTA
ncbi:MAG: sulfotransferase domain-containing protein [Kiloniellales bacterium]|nr:sulfotransferase domain-containing protein [Kiloniellales bacterium]